jgi:starvation-inducible DNA-binding protein
MNSINTIGLDTKQSEDITQQLNILLSSYQIQYMNVRGFHWNVSGEAFFELHEKFEEIYNTLLTNVDEIAERILTIEGKPLHGFSDYLSASVIAEVKDKSEGREMVAQLVDAYGKLISLQRSILTLASEAGDEGTASLMSDYIKAQEKSVWMFRAYLGN